MGTVGDIRDAMFKNLIPEERVWEVCAMKRYECEVQETMCYMVEIEAADEDAAREGAMAFLDDLQGIRAHCEIHVDVQEVCT